MSRMTNEMMQRHTTRTQLQRIESEDFREMERRFSKTKQRIQTMRDHTVEGIDSLISMT